MIFDKINKLLRFNVKVRKSGSDKTLEKQINTNNKVQKNV